jgi:hypothetical protein
MTEPVSDVSGRATSTPRDVLDERQFRLDGLAAPLARGRQAQETGLARAAEAEDMISAAAHVPQVRAVPAGHGLGGHIR